MNTTQKKKQEVMPPLSSYLKQKDPEDSEDVDIEFSSDEDIDKSIDGEHIKTSKVANQLLRHTISDYKSANHAAFNNDRASHKPSARAFNDG